MIKYSSSIVTRNINTSFCSVAPVNIFCSRLSHIVLECVPIAYYLFLFSSLSVRFRILKAPVNSHSWSFSCYILLVSNGIPTCFQERVCKTVQNKQNCRCINPFSFWFSQLDIKSTSSRALVKLKMKLYPLL